MSDEFDYEKDLAIAPHQLDEEILRQPVLYAKYANEVPFAQAEMASNILNKTLTFGLGTMYGFHKNELIELDDEQRKKIYGGILGGFKDFARLCNLTICEFYDTKIRGVSLEEKGLNKGYKLIEKQYGIKNCLNGQAKGQVYGIVKSHFKKKHGKKLMGTGEAVLPKHKANGTHPIQFHQDAIKIHKENDKFYIIYHIFDHKWAKTEGILFPWVAFRIKFKKRDKVGIASLEKVLSQEWKKGCGRLKRNKNKGTKYIMQLVVGYEPSPFKKLSKNVVMGIDRGVNNPATIHFRIDGKPMIWEKFIGNGHDILISRNFIKKEIVKIIRALKQKNSSLAGPIRKEMKIKLKGLRGKEQRIMKTISQNIASEIADCAKRQGAGIWQLEKLSKGIKGNTWLARNWAPGMLLDCIRWQAKQLGAEIIEIDPKYTSQMCSKCGYINKENRPKNKKGASFFKCTNCGYEKNADKNAARNISDLDIEKRIELSIQNNIKVANATGDA